MTPFLYGLIGCLVRISYRMCTIILENIIGFLLNVYSCLEFFFCPKILSLLYAFLPSYVFSWQLFLYHLDEIISYGLSDEEGKKKTIFNKSCNELKRNFVNNNRNGLFYYLLIRIRLLCTLYTHQLVNKSIKIHENMRHQFMVNIFQKYKTENLQKKINK